MLSFVATRGEIMFNVLVRVSLTFYLVTTKLRRGLYLRTCTFNSAIITRIAIVGFRKTIIRNVYLFRSKNVFVVDFHFEINIFG